LKPIRVLIADDEPILRLALSIFLLRQGYEVEQAEDAEEAFQMATSGRFHIAMVDVRMPGDGIALLHRLDAATGWTGQAILMTGDHTQPRVRDEVRKGRPYLTKPFDMMAAVRLIESLCQSTVETN
jgi:DNA-binding NtrC family response regulator